MSSSNLARWGGLAAVAGGVLLVLWAFLLILIFSPTGGTRVAIPALRSPVEPLMVTLGWGLDRALCSTGERLRLAGCGGLHDCLVRQFDRGGAFDGVRGVAHNVRSLLLGRWIGPWDGDLDLGSRAAAPGRGYLAREGVAAPLEGAAAGDLPGLSPLDRLDPADAHCRTRIGILLFGRAARPDRSRLGAAGLRTLVRDGRERPESRTCRMSLAAEGSSVRGASDVQRMPADMCSMQVFAESF